MFRPISAAYAQSDLFGKFIFISLTLLSIASWVLFFYKIWLAYRLEISASQAEKIFQKNKRAPFLVDLDALDHQTGLINPFMSLYHTLKNSALTLLKKNKELKEQNLSSNTFLSSTDIEQLSSQIEMKIYVERKAFEKYMIILSTTFSLAPLLGLLGTVWGISVTLVQLPNSAQALSNNAVLSGLSMALGTTVYGIVVAIFALIFNNYLKGRIDSYVVRMNQFSSDLLHSVEIQYRAVDVS